jgi:hypothetical protein
MASYKIEAHSVTGIKGTRYESGQIVDESDLIQDHISDLVKNGSISLIEEKKNKKEENG